MPFFIILSVVLLVFMLWRWRHAQQKHQNLLQEKKRAVHDAIREGEERERQRLQGELHDGIASNLIAIKLKLENLSHSTLDSDELLGLVKQTYDEVRRVAHNLSPMDFEQQTLRDALKEFVSRFSYDSCVVLFRELAVNEAVALPHEVSLILYRASQELVQNALRHAQASQIRLDMTWQKSTLQIKVEDDGVGFDVDILNQRPNTGLSHLIRHLQKIGAKVIVQSVVGEGTQVSILLMT